jgi:hypothetical protein
MLRQTTESAKVNEYINDGRKFLSNVTNLDVSELSLFHVLEKKVLKMSPTYSV